MQHQKAKFLLVTLALSCLLSFDSVNSLDAPVTEKQDASNVTSETLWGRSDVNWFNVDRRQEQNWTNLYPFGERYFDSDILSRPYSNEQQIDLDFFYPFFGFRFNYTFINQDGFIAFSFPNQINTSQSAEPGEDPFPIKNWPEEVDPSFVAAFMKPQTRIAIGENAISHVWYRVVQRPSVLIGYDIAHPWNDKNLTVGPKNILYAGPDGNPVLDRYGNVSLKTQIGRLQDPALLDEITSDIRDGAVDARGFTADFAMIVTFEHMGEPGGPRYLKTDYKEAISATNTYQVILATDEIRSYCIFNGASLNRSTTNPETKPIVGLNGGNGTEFFEMPFFGDAGIMSNPTADSSTGTPGRWILRVDENVVLNGCSNESLGRLQLSQSYGDMIGGFWLNVSGKCFQPEDVIKLKIRDTVLDCERIDMVKARCFVPSPFIIPASRMDVSLSVDGGETYAYFDDFTGTDVTLGSQVYLTENLTDYDPAPETFSWTTLSPKVFNINWQPLNFSGATRESKVDIILVGISEQRENLSDLHLEYIDSLAAGVENRGRYELSMDQLHQAQPGNITSALGALKVFDTGFVKVQMSNSESPEFQHSEIIPLGWYYSRNLAESERSAFAGKSCEEWVEKEKLMANLSLATECPCFLDQANIDLGRFIPEDSCDSRGDSLCPNNRPARHCVVQAFANWDGSSQKCCYNHDGNLIFSQDFVKEINSKPIFREGHHDTFLGAGVPLRASPFGSYPYDRPSRIPRLSHLAQDVLPFQKCCKWSMNCDQYYTARPTSNCLAYNAPTAGFAYGGGHFLTYDGLNFTFNGNGYYVLSKLVASRFDFMAQVRLEQPRHRYLPTLTNGSIVTGVAVKDNQSDVVEVYARPYFRRWRYHMDVFVNGRQIFFDKPWKKQQMFQGVTILSPGRNMNTSEIRISFSTGVGVRVTEADGALAVAVILPPEYEASAPDSPSREESQSCDGGRKTVGLLGSFNKNSNDDLEARDCSLITTNANKSLQESLREIYFEFGEKWKIDGIEEPLLFNPHRKPIHGLFQFSSPNYVPQFDPEAEAKNPHSIASLDGAKERCQGGIHMSCMAEVFELGEKCKEIQQCMHDYLIFGDREMARTTLRQEFDSRAEQKELKKRLRFNPLERVRHDPQRWEISN